MNILKQANVHSHELTKAVELSLSRDVPLRACAYEDLAQAADALRSGHWMPVGSVEFVRKAMEVSRVKEPEPMSYPAQLLPDLGREVKLVSALEALRGPGGKACSGGAPEVETGRAIFVKPLKTKEFTGFVLPPPGQREHLECANPELGTSESVLHDREQFSALVQLAERDPQSLVWISGVVRFVSEYRCYIVDGQIRGFARYDDGPDDAPAAQLGVAAKAAQLLKQVPGWSRGYSIDVGVLDTGQTQIVECNDGWALGLYGNSLRTADYFDLLWLRWQQICSQR